MNYVGGERKLENKNLRAVYAKNKLDRSSNGTVNCRHGETDAENMK
jgi:hypothetical protein